MNYTKISGNTQTKVSSTNPATNNLNPSTAGTGNGPSTTEPNSEVERTVGLTSYIDNQNTIADQRACPGYTDTMDMLRQHHTEGLDVKQVASRPVFVFSITWSAADVPGTLLAYRNLPLDILNASPIKLQKMQRYQFFSGDIVIRVVASAMAFQAGRLWMSFEAARNERGARVATLNPQSVTSLDGIEFDPAVPTPLEFRVKYFAPISEWDRIGQYGFGSVLFSVLSPLNSASTSSTVTFSMQAWFENLTFGVPTAEPFELSVAPAIAMQRAYRQSHVEKKEAERTHVVSDALETVSEVAGLMGKFPLISGISHPVSWATGMAARAARMFGFSKPSTSNAPMRVEMFPQSTAHFMDGSSDAVLLTATSNYETASGPVFGTDIDEMDIGYICSRMPLVGSYNWDTTFAIGQPVAAFPVTPGLCAPVLAAGSVSYGTYATTPMSFVASMFKYWAGSIKFRIEAVSTQFHAGRLLVAYVPDFDPLGSFNITEAANYYSIVWDITTSSHIEFEVPYMSNVPYLETFIDALNVPYIIDGETTGTGPRDRIRKVANGAIVMFCLNQLVAPSTASNNISLLIWMGGGKDITFMEPTLGEFVVSSGRDKTDRVGKYYDNAVMTQPSHNFASSSRVEVAERSHYVNVEYDSSDTPSDEDRPCFARRAIRQSLDLKFLTDLKKIADTAKHSVPVISNGVDENMIGSQQNDSNFESWMPMQYISPMDRAKLVSGECITNLRLLTRRMSPAFTILPLNATTAGQLQIPPPQSNHVLCLDMDYFSSIAGTQDNAVYNSTCGRVVSGGNRWMIATPTFLSYISYLYTYVRGTRRFLICSRPSAVINGAPFHSSSATAQLPDTTDPIAHASKGEFDVRVSNVVSNEPYTYVPWFRPEETIYDYNNSNESFASIAANYQFGLGSLYSSDAYVKRIGSDGTSLEVAVPPGTNLPVRLLADPDDTPTNYNVRVKGNIPRKRRFLEIRYRPHTTAFKGITANFPATTWPLPTTIYEAAGDDLSFGYLQQPPLITRVHKAHIFMNADGSIRRL
jgi:hypothetical protein